MTDLPAGFRSYVANLGIKDETDDFVVIASDTAVPTAAVFTQSRFAGPSVTLSRRHVANGLSQAAVVISKNANVATGQPGIDDADTVARIVAERVGCDPTDVVLTSTGVIGRRYPIGQVTQGLNSIPQPLPSTDADGPARAMMTTDTVPKLAAASIPRRVAGHASSGWQRGSA